MAIARMARTILTICIATLAIQGITAQMVASTNDTSIDNSTTHFTLNTILSKVPYHADTVPLTNGAGLQGSLSELQTIDPEGPLVLVDPQTIASLRSAQIAYISCEPGDYTSGAMSITQLVDMAANAKPDAIVFYSVYASQCNYTPATSFSYQSFYSMISANSSATVLAGLQQADPAGPQSSLVVDPNSYNANGSGNDDGAGGNVLGKSPTTAVAMIILYSITGIITALFLAIIVVGAIRAHRHPERYGPRRVIGRPRQSRAKGIARAMLETLPIVKFGDREDDKLAANMRDVELAGTSHNEGTTGTEETGEQSGPNPPDSAVAPATDGPDIVKTEAAEDAVSPAREGVADPTTAANNGLACSVCVDDFVKGQDIRVLPCKHKFHPECIDPWLLNVSGTCPLCRVDLHPTRSHDPEAGDEMAEDLDDGPSFEIRESPNVDVSERRNRRSRILHTLNIGRMRHATPEERIEALRRLRAENQASDSTAEQGGRRGSRFSRRISRAFGGSRPHSGILNSRPVSEIPPQAAEPVPADVADTRPADEESSPHAVAAETVPATITESSQPSAAPAEAASSTTGEATAAPPRTPLTTSVEAESSKNPQNAPPAVTVEDTSAGNHS